LKEVDTETTFRYWLKTAKPGDGIIYYNGFLMRDREVFLRCGGFVDQFPQRIKTAIAAWNAYMNGEVKLVQKKRGTFEYEYIATKS
jgi:hypothetical protein